MRLRILLLIILLVLWQLTGCTNSNQSGTNPQTSPPAHKSETADPMVKTSPVTLTRAEVTRVVDGDTLEVKIKGKLEKVRLIGVDTPETVKPNHPVEPYGKEASGFTKKTLLGKNIYLETDVNERDKYGRLLAYAWLDTPTEISDQEIRQKQFNALLLLDGYAQLMTIAPNVKYVEYYTKYAKEARGQSRGLWGLELNQKEANKVPAKPGTTGPQGETIKGY